MTVIERLDKKSEKQCDSCGKKIKARYKISVGILGCSSLSISVCEKCANDIIKGIQDFQKLDNIT